MTPLPDRRAPEWAAAANFLGAYLHQDFDAEYATPWDAVIDFEAGTSPDVRSAAATGLRRLVTTFTDEAELERVASSFGMAYYPPADGVSYREWLTAAAARLEEPDGHSRPPEHKASTS